VTTAAGSCERVSPPKGPAAAQPALRPGHTHRPSPTWCALSSAAERHHTCHVKQAPRRRPPREAPHVRQLVVGMRAGGQPPCAGDGGGACGAVAGGVPPWVLAHLPGMGGAWGRQVWDKHAIGDVAPPALLPLALNRVVEEAWGLPLCSCGVGATVWQHWITPARSEAPPATAKSSEGQYAQHEAQPGSTCPAASSRCPASGLLPLGVSGQASASAR